MCVCVCVCVSVNHELVRAIIHQPFKLGLPNLDQRCKRPWLRNLLFSGTIDLDLQGQKYNFKVKIYPILSMWVCPCDKSPPIEVSISKFGPKMHLSTVKVPIDFGLDWSWSLVSFLITNLCFFTKLLLFICVSLYMFSEAIASECSTFHRAPHICGFFYARGKGPTVDRETVYFISWCDHRSSMSRRLGDWHWILQAPIGFRQIKHTSHAAILYANNRQSPKQQ